MLTSVFLRERPLPWLLASLPTAVFVRLFNFGVQGQGLAERLTELAGKRVCIRVTDLPFTLDVTVTKQGLRVTEPGRPAHVSIQGSLADFGRLATRSEDPDTLFFERRLCITGETETGLLIKNMFDALEWDWEAHIRSVLAEPLANLSVGVGRRLHEALRER